MHPKYAYVKLYGSHMCFSCINIVGTRGTCLNAMPLGRVFKHHPRDPTGVNVMKQTCVIVIIACLNIPFLTLDFSKQNCVSIKLRSSKCRHIVIDVRKVFANKPLGEIIRRDCNAFPCNAMQTNQDPDRLCQVKSHAKTARE